MTSRPFRSDRHRALSSRWPRQFGGCDCSLGRIVCNCALACQKPEYEPRRHWFTKLLHRILGNKL